MGDILVTNLRKECGEGDDKYVTLNTRFLPRKEAVERMFKYEFGYGGQVTDITPTRVVVETQVLNKQDRTIFEPEEEEDIKLFQFLASKHYEARMRLRDPKKLEEMAEKLIKLTGGKALFIRCVADIIEGDASVKELISKLREDYNISDEELKLAAAQ